MGTRPLRIPKDSLLPIVTNIYAVVMIILSFVHFGLNSGEFYVKYIFPLSFSSFFTAIYTTAIFCYPILFLIFTIVFAKKNIKMMLIPIALPSAYYVISVIYGVFISAGYFLFTAQWFLIISYLLIFVLFVLTTSNFIKSKIPLVVTSLLIAVLSIILTALRLEPFAFFDSYGDIYNYEFIYLSSFLSFLSYILGIGSLALALSNDPTKEYYEATSTQQAVNGITADLLEVKNIAVCVFLSVVTFGIYGLIWIYSLCKKIKLLNKEFSDSTNEFLCLLLVPFYGLYWMYTRGKKITATSAKYNIQIADNSTLYLVLSLFGLGIIAYALIQNDLNTIAAALNSNSETFVSEIPQPYPMSNESMSIKYSTDTLRNLFALKEQGIITEEEFEAKKKELLSRM